MRRTLNLPRKSRHLDLTKEEVSDAESRAVPLSLPAAATLVFEDDKAHFSRAELDQMLAPIALYPDTVLSHVLIASTYPLEVVEAARWSHRHPDLQGEEAVEAIEDMDWDPSVKAEVNPRMPRVEGIPEIGGHRVQVSVVDALVSEAAMVFVVVELRARSPMLPLQLFRIRYFSGANLITLSSDFVIREAPGAVRVFRCHGDESRGGFRSRLANSRYQPKVVAGLCG